jgi:hypothetical protein
MIYILAVILGFVACVMSFAFEITAGNICHLKHGRQPNAGAALFPTIPVIPLLAVGAAWLLRTSIPAHAVSILVGSFLLFACLWTISFVRLRAQFRQITTSQPNPAQLGGSANDKSRNA